MALAKRLIRRGYVDTSVGQLHLRIAGEKMGRRPLMCFHMSPFSGVIYERFLLEMARDRMAIAPDTPGFGNSDAPANVPQIGDYAAVMGELIDSLELEQVDVMGFHTGALIALELGQQRPHCVRHIVMISAAIFTADELAALRAENAKMRITRDGSHLAERWAIALKYSGPGQTPELLAEYFFEWFRNPQISWWGHYAAFSYDIEGALRRTVKPLLVLNTNDDLASQTRRCTSLLSNGRLLELPEWGHGFLDVHTEEVGTIIRDFVG
jgi:pimeloyl-ACP methyl ester carboxylesterase